MFPQGFDCSRAADPADTDGDGSLQFRPKADGLTERELAGWDDWEIFAVDLCRTLAGHVQDVDRKVRCLDWQW